MRESQSFLNISLLYNREKNGILERLISKTVFPPGEKSYLLLCPYFYFKGPSYRQHESILHEPANAFTVGMPTLVLRCSKHLSKFGT